jgi:hypothetical protein
VRAGAQLPDAASLVMRKGALDAVGGKKPGRAGRREPVNQGKWPPSGARREWLEFCDQAHKAGGMPSFRELGEAASFSASWVGQVLRGERLPAAEKDARALLEALWTAGKETEKGAGLYRAALAEHRQAARATGPPGWWLRSGYVSLVGDIAPLRLLGRDDELDELASWCAGGDEAYVRW